MAIEETDNYDNRKHAIALGKSVYAQLLNRQSSAFIVYCKICHAKGLSKKRRHDWICNDCKPSQAKPTVFKLEVE